MVGYKPWGPHERTDGVLERAGRRELAVIDSGTDAWAEIPGHRLEVG